MMGDSFVLEGPLSAGFVAEGLRHLPRLAFGRRALVATAVEVSVKVTVSKALMDARPLGSAIDVVVTVAVTGEATAKDADEQKDCAAGQ